MRNKIDRVRSIFKYFRNRIERVKGLCNEIDGVDIGELLLNHVGNTLNELLFGITYSNEDKTWKWLKYLLEEGIKYIGVAGPLNFLPLLRLRNILNIS